MRTRTSCGFSTAKWGQPPFPSKRGQPSPQRNRGIRANFETPPRRAPAIACGMARAPRIISANECYHVINRGNQKARVFHSSADYAAFLAYMREAQDRIELPLL